MKYALAVVRFRYRFQSIRSLIPLPFQFTFVRQLRCMSALYLIFRDFILLFYVNMY